MHSYSYNLTKNTILPLLFISLFVINSKVLTTLLILFVENVNGVKHFFNSISVLKITFMYGFS